MVFNVNVSAVNKINKTKLFTVYFPDFFLDLLRFKSISLIVFDHL